MDMLSKAKTGYEGAMSTLAKIGVLNVECLETLTEKQMESAKYYSELGIAQLKGMQSIDGVESVKGFSSASMETGTKITKKILEDGKTFVGMGALYKDGIVEIAKSVAAKS